MSEKTSLKAIFFPIISNSSVRTKSAPSNRASPDITPHPAGLSSAHQTVLKPCADSSHHARPRPETSRVPSRARNSSTSEAPPGPGRNTSLPAPVPPFGNCSVGSSVYVIDHVPPSVRSSFCI